MRTTVNIDEDLLTQAKSLALRKRAPLGQVLDEALRTYFARRDQPVVDFTWSHVAIEVPGGRGMRPGINWRSNSAMLDLMDDDQ